METKSHKTCRVLVVDDDMVTSALLCDFIEEVGFEVRAVMDATEAIETIKTWKPNLVTLDLVMPGSNGDEILSKLKADPETANVPVIVISVIADSAERKGVLVNAQGILSKPLNLKKLTDILERYAEIKSESEVKVILEK